MLLLIVLKFLPSVFVFLTSISIVVGYEDTAFEQQLSNLQNEGCTLPELQKWWQVHLATVSTNAPRVFPLCIAKINGGDWPPGLSRFRAILNDLELKDERLFRPEKHLLNIGTSGGSGVHITQFANNRIKITMKDRSEKENELLNWRHFELRLSSPVKGVIVQAITGPLGLPGGEFNTDLKCNKQTSASIPDSSRKFVESQHLVPCSFSPRSAYEVPNVYVLDVSGIAFRTVTFKWRWTEARCHETAFFQFLVVLTSSYKVEDYKVYLTPVMYLKPPVLWNGISTPFYHHGLGKDKGNINVACTIPTGVNFQTEWNLRIPPNIEYDNCVTKGEGRGTGLFGYTCPPGPFECPKMIWWRDRDRLNLKQQEWLKVLKNRGNWKDCCEVDVDAKKLPKPEVTTTTTTRRTTTKKTTTTTSTPTPTTSETTTTVLTSTAETPTSATSTTPTTTSEITTSATRTTPTTASEITNSTSTPPTTTSESTMLIILTPSPSENTTSNSTSPELRNANKTLPQKIVIVGEPPPPKIIKPKAPPHHLTTTLGPHDRVVKQLETRSFQAEAASKVTHGGLCIFVWLVLIPLADHVARYYKDFPEIQAIGLGFWLIAHVILHMFSVILIWLSFGLVVGTGENKLGNVTGLHFFLGGVAVLLQLGGFITAILDWGVFRESEAFKFVASHALGGHGAFGFAVMAILLSDANYAVKWLSFGLITVNAIAIGVSVYVEHRQGKMLNIQFHRARCPVLQRIVMDNGAPPPLMRVKIIVLVVMTGLLFLLYIYSEVVHKKMVVILSS